MWPSPVNQTSQQLHGETQPALDTSYAERQQEQAYQQDLDTQDYNESIGFDPNNPDHQAAMDAAQAQTDALFGINQQPHDEDDE